MRKLLIRSCLIAGLTWTYSCASNKETAPQAPAPIPAVQPEQTAPADHPAPWAPAPAQQEILPEDENEESAPDCAPPGCRKPCCTIWTAS